MAAALASTGSDVLVFATLALIPATWIFAAFWIARVGQRQGLSFAVLLLLGLFFSPFLSGIVVLIRGA